MSRHVGQARNRNRVRRRVPLLALPLILCAPLAAAPATAQTGPERPAIRPGSGSISEGDAGSRVLQIPVRLTVATGQTVTASWATMFGPNTNPPAPAVPGEDFTSASGTVEFGPGDIYEVIEITVSGDTTGEDAEWIVVRLSDPVNARIGGTPPLYGLGFGVIIDDDLPELQAAQTVTQAEGDAGTSTIQIPYALSEPSATTVTATWSTIDHPSIDPRAAASPGQDYIAATGTVTFEPGETRTTIPVQVRGDTAPERDEWLVIKVSEPVGAKLQGRTLGLAGTVILDDDTGVQVLPGGGDHLEGDAGTTLLAIPVRLNTASAVTVTVDWETRFFDLPPEQAEATPGVDYEVSSGTVTFVAGDTAESIYLTVFGDTDFEDTETVLVQFSNPVNATFANPTIGTLGFGEISNDDVSVP